MKRNRAINFICQFDWAMGYSDIWLNINLGCRDRDQ